MGQNKMNILIELVLKGLLNAVISEQAFETALKRATEGDLVIMPLPDRLRSAWFVAVRGADGKLRRARVAGLVAEVVDASPDGKDPRPGYVSREFEPTTIPAPSSDIVVG